MDSLVYALIQTVHNLNAALLLGIPLANLQRGLQGHGAVRGLRLLFTLWALQGMTGMAFGAASYGYYGALPDLQPVARDALGVKVICVIAGLGVSAWLLLRPPRGQQCRAWIVLTMLAGTALTAAAFLRWYS